MNNEAFVDRTVKLNKRKGGKQRSANNPSSLLYYLKQKGKRILTFIFLFRQKSQAEGPSREPLDLFRNFSTTDFPS